MEVYYHFLYAYCENNPIMYVDSDGELLGSILAFLMLTLMAAFLTEIEVSGSKAEKTGPQFINPEFFQYDLKDKKITILSLNCHAQRKNVYVNSNKIQAFYITFAKANINLNFSKVN